ncbi:hypothetical protein D3C77_658390 [compost metagenome]
MMLAKPVGRRCIATLCARMAICFPESALPFSDKGTQGRDHFCEIMAALLYEE